ncbi:conserved unknown protein [Ectocarpus siliculosus]|uniref:Uncharacterized protein n=1 Tax=Ectocarpus siliculosus TaxID=2880 RepID=D8LBW1_ECTSI|nr:conserved unknown protein [Ectocarpus siliculosus]|eukprot:CBN79144.1 conserved unknown protein [Ectocarpus siliculosus]
MASLGSSGNGALPRQGGRVSPGQQQQHQGPLRRRPLSGKTTERDASDDYGGILDDSWGRGGGPRFARRGGGPRLEPPRPPKRPTRPCWPTPSVEASVLRYIETVREEKGDGLASAVPTVSWPEHAEMEKGDVVVTVEHCHGCHRHRMTTRHDPEVYLSHANAVKELLIESLRELPVRLAVVLKKSPLRSRTLSPGGDGGGSGSGSASATTLRRRRVGALEVQVAARHPNRGHLLHAQVIHSKLASGRWPRLGTSVCLPNRLRRALESWGFETDMREIDGRRKHENSTDGAGADTPSAQHPPRPRVRIPWEFDHRDRMRRGDEVTTSPHQGARIPEKNAHTDGYNDNSKSRGGARTTVATGKEVATNNHDSHGRGSNKPTASGEHGSETGNYGDRRRSGRSPERPGMSTTTLSDRGIRRDDGCSPSKGRETEGTVAAGVLAQENSSKAAEAGVGRDAVGGPVRAEEGGNDISAEEDEYDADFASQAEDSLVEEVDEDADDAAPGPPPFVAPKAIDSIHEHDEEEFEDAVWDQDEEEWEEEKKEGEEEVEEEEYGDDFDS